MLLSQIDLIGCCLILLRHLASGTWAQWRPFSEPLTSRCGQWVELLWPMTSAATTIFITDQSRLNQVIVAALSTIMYGLCLPHVPFIYAIILHEWFIFNGSILYQIERVFFLGLSPTCFFHIWCFVTVWPREMATACSPSHSVTLSHCRAAQTTKAKQVDVGTWRIF